MHQNVPLLAAADRVARCRGGQDPMQREVHRAGTLCRAGPRRSLAGCCRVRQSKQDSTQMRSGCTLMNADGPESGMAVHGRHHPAGPGEARRRGGPCPIRVHERPSACICVESFVLASPRAAGCREGTPMLRARQNPMHQNGASVPATGRDGARAVEDKTLCTVRTLHRWFPRRHDGGRIPCDTVSVTAKRDGRETRLSSWSGKHGRRDLAREIAAALWSSQ